MKLRLFSMIAVFAAFSIYTAIVVVNHGYTGFIELALTVGALAYLVHRTAKEQHHNRSEKGTVPFSTGLIG